MKKISITKEQRNAVADKMVLAEILKNCTSEFKDCTVDEIAENYIETPQINNADVDYDDPLSYDIRFNAMTPDSGKRIGVVINVEEKDNYGYSPVERGIVYLRRMLGVCFGMEEYEKFYSRISKIYPIFIFINPDNNSNTASSYSFTGTDLIKNEEVPKKECDLIDTIVVNLPKSNEECEGVMKTLKSLLKYGRKENKIVSNLTIDCDEKGFFLVYIDHEYGDKRYRGFSADKSDAEKRDFAKEHENESVLNRAFDTGNHDAFGRSFLKCGINLNDFINRFILNSTHPDSPESRISIDFVYKTRDSYKKYYN